MKKAPRHGGSPVWRKPRRVVRLLAVLAVMAIVSVGLETSPVSAAPQNKVLILTESVRNGASSVEATHLASLGFADEAAILAKIPRGEGQRIFRAIEPDELADLADLGAFRTVAGLEGKYFWPTQAQAGEFAEMMTKRGMGGPYCIASGCIPARVLRQIEAVLMDGLGSAYFIPEEYLPLIDNILIHGG